jgi:hypothetical protein
MPKQDEALRPFAVSIANTISDYRSGEIAKPTAEHVLLWATQFPNESREGLLSGLDHVFKQTYISKSDIMRFIKGVTRPNKFTGADPAAFWRAANILDIQGGGNSQRDVRALLAEVLESELNIDLNDCGSAAGAFIYVDDIIFSGNRVVMDCRNWIPAYAPNEFSLQILVAASHSAADYYVEKAIQKIAAEANKKLVAFGIWRLKTLKNLSNDGAGADVLRLRAYPDDAESRAYWEQHGNGEAPALLRGNVNNQSNLYASEVQRTQLEQTLWSAGVSIKGQCGHLKVMHRPLGYTSTNSANKLGFGSLIVTYRNCPNNSPLALWVGDPWYPLLPRRVN